ncbi:uncharacterized protein LOC100893417 [Strongylocentrotus purpuratus]|uniref:BRCA1-associated ATM activator 1 n=1 Tax=Strongylocentrotus purpuratus TaxID=7668 RepID=A0A7M7NPM0_STRPU|nr:uncharacterized protein LOC100893417 [Strongylocentrotus purpuratus]
MTDLESMVIEAERENSDALTLRYLGQVLDVLLDPSKKIVDDTSLQRLLEYCKTIFSQKDICKEEAGVKHVFDFLEACCVKEPHQFDPCALTFALQLVRCLSSNQELLNRLTKGDDHNNSEGGGGLLVRMLKRASSADFFSDPCMKEAWLASLRTLNDIEKFWTICIQTDALRIAMDLLKDTSMFVVKSSQNFLARILILQYRQDTPKTPKELQKAMSNDGQEPSSLQEMVQDCPGEGSSKMADGDGPVQDDQDMKINGDDAGGGDGEGVKRKLDEEDEESDSRAQKKSRLSASCDGIAGSASDLEVIQLSKTLMKSEEAAPILASLLLGLKASDSHEQALLQVSPRPSDSEIKTILSLGVFRCVLQDAADGDLKSRGLHLLKDVAMTTRCKRLLSMEGLLCDKLCDDVVEFLGCLLQLESKMCSSLTSSLLLDVQSLPYELAKKGLVKPAIHLAFSVLKLCSTIPQSSKPDAASSVQSAFSVLVGPVCVILERSPLKTEVILDQDVLEELGLKMSSGRHSPSIICTALSALGDFVKEGHCLPCLPASQVFHLAAVLLNAFTPNAKKTSQSKGVMPDYKSLIGSRKIVTSLLDLAHVSLTGACLSPDIWLLVATINTILKNPDAEYQVILKILTIVPDLVPAAMETKEHPVSIENTKRDALMMEVGYALQKRMCNIEWEVRDSTITCVGKLLQKKSDPVKEWLKRNNLHRRLWESLADSESYVRSSTLQALPVLGSSKELWEDVLTSSRITQVEVIAKLTEVIKSDSEAFPRRAAIGCLLTWLKDEAWMQESIKNIITKSKTDKPSSPPLQDTTEGKGQDSDGVSLQGQTTDGSGVTSCSGSGEDSVTQEQTNPEEKVKDEGFLTVAEMISDALFATTDDSGETTSSSLHKSALQKKRKPEQKARDEECGTLGGMVLDAVSIATCDFDWEMKLHALDFFLHLLNHYIPGYDSTHASSSIQSYRPMQRTKIEELLGDEEMKVLVCFFSRTGCLAKIERGSRDEDVSVARKACEMLQSLKVALGDLFKKMESPAQSSQEDRTENSVSSEQKDQCSVNKQVTTTGSSIVTGADILTTGSPGTLTDSSVSDIDRQSVCDLIGQLFENDWNDLLNHRESDNVEGPVSLMMDILAAADEKDENLLDCY